MLNHQHQPGDAGEDLGGRLPPGVEVDPENGTQERSGPTDTLPPSPDME